MSEAERRIEYVPISEIRPDARNPKRHADEAIDRSISEFSFTEPVLVDDRTGLLAAGHGRVERLTARKEAGLEAPTGVTVREDGEWCIPVVRGWASKDDSQAAAYLVASNKLVEAGGWDMPSLSSILHDLPELLLESSGFTLPELQEIDLGLGHPYGVVGDPDAVPPIPVIPVSKLGDVWLLGPHRVLCGDATKVDDYNRVLGGENLAGAIITDPPYGVAIGAKNRARDSIDRAGPLLTDLEGDQGIEEVEALWRATFTVFAAVLPPGTPYYIFGPQNGDLGLLLLLLLRDCGLLPRHILIWMKNRPSFSIGRLDYDYQHEPIVYGWMPGAAHPWHADGTRQSILQFDRPAASNLHPTMKPVDLLSHLIENSTTRGQHVLDPFGGSGSTLIACHQTGRVARLIELDAKYVDVICRRYEEATGTIAVLEATGEPHSFIDA